MYTLCSLVCDHQCCMETHCLLFRTVNWVSARRWHDLETEATCPTHLSHYTALWPNRPCETCDISSWLKVRDILKNYKTNFIFDVFTMCYRYQTVSCCNISFWRKLLTPHGASCLCLSDPLQCRWLLALRSPQAADFHCWCLLWRYQMTAMPHLWCSATQPLTIHTDAKSSLMQKVVGIVGVRQ